jgi:predicted acyltransferase
MSSKKNDLLSDQGRLASVDLFRGVIMFLLLGGSAGLFWDQQSDLSGRGLVSIILRQFQHTSWKGLRLADLGQPFFMFISGVSMAASYQKRWERNQTWRGTFYHCLTRAGLLFLLGWGLFHINSNEGVTQATLYVSVLPQLAFASIIAFMTLKIPPRLQVTVSCCILICQEMLYRFWSVPGFDQPFIPGRNFGSYLDLKLFGKLSEMNIVAFNMVPAAVYMVLGIVAAGLLRHSGTHLEKLGRMIKAGAVGSSLGLALSMMTPIIRRLETSSFVILASGLAFLALAFGYWLAEMKGLSRRSTVLYAVGRNPLFIYLFAFSGGMEWLRVIARPFSTNLGGLLGPEGSQILTSLSVWGMSCGICYVLYKRKVFIKI